MNQAKQKRMPRPLRLVLRGIWVSVLFIFLVGAATGTLLGSYFFSNAMQVVNGEPVIDLTQEKEAQSQTTIVYAYDKNGDTVEYARLYGEQNRIWIDLELLQHTPSAQNRTTEFPMIADAYIALEDKRFWDHKGVDFVRIAGAVKNGFDSGASTLTQQLIKNLTNMTDASLIRKFREILNALNLERHNDKLTILEAYMNEVYLGRGCYGIKTGAEKYFGKEVQDLNLAECASLAAITQNPSFWDPLRYPEKNRRRQLKCLKQMLEQEKITQEQHDEAVAYEMVFTNSENYVRDPKKDIQLKAQPEQKNNHYVDFIIERVIADLMKHHDWNKAEATRKLYYGGLKIYAAVDMNIQDMVEDVYKKRVTFSNLKGTAKNPLNSAMTVMDYEGRVVAIVGEAGEKSGNRSLNRASQSFRAPGSTIKPLAVYGPAIEKNLITWSTMIENYAFPYKGKLWPHNVDGTYGNHQFVTVQYGLSHSLNTISARVVHEKLSVKESFTFLSENFGFTRLDSVNDWSVPPMATGSMTNGFSTLEEAAAFATFGNGGMYYEPYSYYRVTNHDGSQVLLERDQEIKRSFSEDTAKIVNEILKTVNLDRFISGNNGGIAKFQRFGKTGTTSDNKDRWFAGGTPYYVASVWFGYDIPKSLGDMSNPAAKIWTEVFHRMHKGLDSGKKFPTTSKAVQKTYCTRTGDLASTKCPTTARGWYRVKNIPKVCETCASYVPEPAPQEEVTQTTERTQAPGGNEDPGDPGNWWNDLFGGHG